MIYIYYAACTFLTLPAMKTSIFGDSSWTTSTARNQMQDYWQIYCCLIFSLGSLTIYRACFVLVFTVTFSEQAGP